MKRMITLIGLLLVFSGLAFPQKDQQDAAKKFKAEVGKSYKKWLNCKVDMLFSTATTHSDITAKVAFQGTPMSGVSVELRKSIFTAGAESESSIEIRKTNSQGIVMFSAAPRGKYTLHVSELLAPTFIEVNVDPDSNRTDDIVLEWPTETQHVKNLRGTLLSADAKKPLEGAKVELIELRSSQSLAIVHTDSTGRYELHAPSKGIYVLRYTPQTDKARYQDFGISLSDEGAEQLPVMRLESKDCGVFLYRN